MMRHQARIAIILFLLIAGPIQAQSDDLPPITVANSQQLALIKTIPFPDAAISIGETRNFAAAFSPDGEQIALGQRDLLTLIKIDDGTTLAEIHVGINYIPHMLYFSSDGNHLAAVDKDSFCVWDISASVITLCASLVINLPNEISDGMNYATARAMTFSADSTQLYAVSTHFNLQGIIVHIYDLKRAREVDRIQIKDCANDSSNLIAFQRTTTHMVCVNYHETQFDQPFVFVYDMDTGELLSSWDIGDEIPEQVVRNQYGTLTDAQSENVSFIPPLVYPYDRYQKLFSPTMTFIAVIPTIGIGVELYGVSDCTATTARDLNLRVEQETDAAVGATFAAGQRLALVAKTTNEGFTWWQTGDGLWVREDVAHIECPRLE